MGYQTAQDFAITRYRLSALDFDRAPSIETYTAAICCLNAVDYHGEEYWRTYWNCFAGLTERMGKTVLRATGMYPSFPKALYPILVPDPHMPMDDA